MDYYDYDRSIDCYGVLDNDGCGDYCEYEDYYSSYEDNRNNPSSGMKIVKSFRYEGTKLIEVNDSLETIEPSGDEDCWIDLKSDEDVKPKDESREFEEPEVYEITSYEDGQRLDIGRGQHSKYLFPNPRRHSDWLTDE